MDTGFNLVFVVVEWHDAHVGTDGWEARQDLVDDGPAIIESCGFLLTPEQGGKKNHVSIVTTWSEDDMVHSVFHIPDSSGLTLFLGIVTFGPCLTTGHSGVVVCLMVNAMYPPWVTC